MACPKASPTGCHHGSLWAPWAGAFSLFLLLWLGHLPLAAATPSGESPGRSAVDSLLRAHLGTGLHDDYFTVTFSTGVSAYSLAGEVIKSRKEVRAFSPQMQIVYVIRNDGDADLHDLQAYFSQLFFIDLRQEPAIMVIPDDALYDQINFGGTLTKWIYVHQRSVAAADNVKLHPPSSYVLPRQVVRIGSPMVTPIQEQGRRLSPYQDLVRPYKPGQLLYVTNTTNNLHVLDMATGAFSRTWDKSSFSATDYYCQHIAKSDSNCEYARRNASHLGTWNRDDNFIFNVRYAQGSIYLATGLQVFVPLKDTPFGETGLIYMNEEGVLETARPNVFAFGYGTLMRLDTALTLRDVSLLDLDSYPERNRLHHPDGSFNGAIDCGFFIQDSILWLDNGPNFTQRHPTMPEVCDKAYSVFALRNGKYQFKRFLEPRYDDGYVARADLHVYTHYVPMAGRLYALMQFEGTIEELASQTRTCTLAGNGAPRWQEQIPTYTEDTSEVRVNYNILTAAAIHGGTRMAVVYFYQDELLLEVLEPTPTGLASVQRTSLRDVPGLGGLHRLYTGNGLTIQDDRLVLLRKGKAGHELWQYPLQFTGGEMENAQAGR